MREFTEDQLLTLELRVRQGDALYRDTVLDMIETIRQALGAEGEHERDFERRYDDGYEQGAKDGYQEGYEDGRASRLGQG